MQHGRDTGPTPEAFPAKTKTAGSKILGEHGTQWLGHKSSKVLHDRGPQRYSEESTDANLDERDDRGVMLQGRFSRGDDAAAWQGQSSSSPSASHVNTPRATTSGRQDEELEFDGSNDVSAQSTSMDTSQTKNDENETWGNNKLAPKKRGERQHSESNWERQKQEIEHLFVTQGRNLREVMQSMRERFNFQASKAQYERQFKKWGFRKNTKRSEWKYIGHRINERKQEGKKSAVYIHGISIPEKKVRREISRCYTSLEDRYAPYTSPQTPEGLAVITPPTSPYRTPSAISCRTPSLVETYSIETHNLPWFRYQEIIDSRGITRGSLIAEKPTTGVLPATDASGIGTSLDTTDLAGANVLSEAQALLLRLGSDKSPEDDSERNQVIHSYLQAVMVERYPEEHLVIIQKIFGSANDDGVFWFLCLIAYLSSNKLISNQQTYQVVRWATVNNLHHLLVDVLSIRTPTVEAFAENIFRYSLDAEDPQSVRLGLLGGVDPDSPLPSSRLRPLQLMATKGNFELVRILLDAGADPNAFTPISESKNTTEAPPRKNQGTGALVKMEEAVAVHPVKDCEKPPLQTAVETGNFELVQLLLRAGADVNRPPAYNSGNTALQAASESGDLELVQLLLRAGANVNHPPAYNSGNTALQAASKSGNLELVRLLLSAGADVNHPPARNLGRTALQAALECGNLEIVRLLLDAGADVNHPPAHDSGRTALQVAVECGNLEIVRLFLEAAADTNGALIHEAGGAALQAAASRGQMGIALEILRFDAALRTGIATACWKTSLVGAAENGRIDMVQLLCNVGAAVSGNTDIPLSEAVHSAERNGHDTVVKLVKHYQHR